MIDVLTSIWQEVFRKPTIGADKNFFELGGNPALARQIILELAKSLERFLPPEVIYQAPTIAALAQLLNQPGATALEPLALLKWGIDLPPVFMAHGLGGSVFEFFDLVKFIGTERPIYGLQARGGYGVEEPFTRLEDSARHFMEAIQSAQPRGPYFLVGYSLGGLVAFEIAQQLSSRGERVALLALVDSYPHESKLAVGQRLRLAARRMQPRIGSAIRPISEYKVELFARGPGRVAARTSLEVRLRARKNAQLAWETYRPRIYPGKICFVKAENVTIYPDDPVAVWTKLVSEVEMQTVPGDHHSMMANHFQELALVLSRFLDQAAGAVR